MSNEPSVQTARGAITPSALGSTLMHEHVFIISTEIAQNWPGRWDEETEVAKAIAQLGELKLAGIDTIVDLTVVGHGRDIERIARVAAAIDLNIVVATGLYTFNDLPFYFHFRGPGTMLGGPEPMVEMFVRDLVEGIAGTGVRAAILKCASDEPGITPGVERVLRAVGEAHVRTNAPISTHTHAASKGGLDQQRIFAEMGVDLTRVVIGHSGDSNDLDYLRRIADAGSFLGMDRFGVDALLSFDDRIATVAKLCELGYAQRMVLSHDTMCFTDWFDPEILAMLTNWRFTHIPQDVLPALGAAGVSDADLRTMLVTNPKQLLAGG